MDALLSTEDAATLAAARSLLAGLAGRAILEANRHPSEGRADVTAYDLGRVSEAADRARESLQNALLVAKVFGESEEAGAVL